MARNKDGGKMIVLNNIAPLNNGLNDTVTIINADQDYEFTLIDDVKLESIIIESDEVSVVLHAHKAGKYHILKLNFIKVKRAKWNPADTFRSFNSHDTTTEAETIDQLYFDPEKTEEDYQIQIIGLGWMFCLDADEMSAFITPQS